MSKTTIAVLHGGRSGEHEVSLRSAASIMDGLRDVGQYEVLPVFISREGIWTLEGVRVAILPEPGIGGLYVLEGEKAGEVIPVDVVFPVLHGTYGEDGTVQGLLELARIPYVGAGVPGSAIGMDKILMKAGLLAAGLPVGPYLWFTVADWEENKKQLLKQIEEELAFPCFVKPANLGSSVGISKAYDSAQLEKAINEALQYDRRVLVEKMLTGCEIECSVLGNDRPEASVPGEIIPCNDFYDYSAKYLDDNSGLEIPAKLAPETIKKVREMAVQTFIALDCAGLGRVDFFVDEKTGEMWIIEINTLPGFTSISMYPKLWEASGISFNELLQKLVKLALERFSQKERLKTTFDPS
ncbi:D-alanine--D-alanine ligase family protein [Dethiobacter alkaliphilus]|uniref:D-alanine--D-alanine ligase n=1 Tax=Dethiobacter alkaliphilus AHT 1 TaxID=555088 RepID=C0GI55_DETAL|nr:D-alanine--D-alanine ligase family protein [Dethiobacter alkaliphilus]EEG76903.1 D-alanine/D-alanine ligase [Dethiobacter alkaliphilus AHT 1]